VKDQKILKIIVLAALPAIPAYFLGKFIITIASSPQYIFLFLTDPLNIAKLFLILVLLGTLSVPILSTNFQSQEQQWIPLGIIVAGFALPQIALYPKAWILLTVSSLLFFLSLGWFRNGLIKTIENTIEIRGGRTFRTQIKYFYLIIAVVTALSFATGHALELREKQVTLKIPEKLLERVVQPFVPVVEKQVGNQLENLVGQQFEQKLNVSGRKEILEFLKEESGETLNEGSIRQKLGISPERLEKVEITKDGNIDLSGALPGATQLLQQRIENILARYQEYVVVFLSTVLFLSAHFLGRLALIFSPVLTTILLAIFKKADIIKVTKETVEAERFTI